MFSRRVPLTRRERILGNLYPRMGLRRWAVYLGKRIQRMPGTPQSIAAGVGSGVAVSFTPFITLHTPLAMGMAWLMRANILGAILGTLMGNPLTSPIMWILSYQAGRTILTLFGWLAEGSAHDAIATLASFDFSAIFTVDFLHAFFLPMVVGSLIMGTIAWFAVFFLVRTAVVKYRQRKARRRAVRLAALRRALAEAGAAGGSDAPPLAAAE